MTKISVHESARVTSALAGAAVVAFGPVAASAMEAAGGAGAVSPSLLSSWHVWAMLAVFGLAYLLVFGEEKLHLRKSKPVMVAAGAIWILVALAYRQAGRIDEAGEHLRHVLLEYAELFLFLLSAMSFVNAMVERQVFEALRSKLSAARLSARGVFWITGAFAFVLSPIADNLTTALVMGAVVISALGQHKKLVAAALVNVVVAANAGGAFSPFGDITTLMIWQKGVVPFGQFFALFVPSLVNWLVPAVIMSFAFSGQKAAAPGAAVAVRAGGYIVAMLFLATIATTVYLHQALHLPSFLGMMLGLGVLKVFGYFLNRAEERAFARAEVEPKDALSSDATWALRRPFDIFGILEKVEWDTLLFFYGVMLCVGGLGAVGALGEMSSFLYGGYGPTVANIVIGALSSIVDNIPLVFAVLTMNPPMDTGQWLLVTLTAGVGGSLLSVGSAAGVALMGLGKNAYTFMAHLKWIGAIALGYAASILVHLVLNRALFTESGAGALLPGAL